MARFARELEKASVDVINVTGGWHEAAVPQIQSDVPAGTYAYLAAKIKAEVNIPVAASNRINNPALAEQILQNRQADLVTVARGFLADSQWALKARSNPGGIRRCIACMNCLDELFAGHGVSCAVNPRCGREQLHTERAARSKKILVVGSGPAGLEAAHIASLRGHRVAVWESSNHIGGQWHIAAVPPGKSEFRSLLDFYRRELAAQKVEIVLNKTADLESIKAAGFDAVILATGAVPRKLPFLPDEGARVLNAWDVLAGCPVEGPDIAVVGGGAAGCETALFLAEKGTLSAESLKFMILNSVEPPETIINLLTRGSYRIRLIEMGDKLAADMGRSPRWTLLRHMRRLGVETFTNTRVSAAAPGHVKIVTADNEEQQLKADTIVLAVGSKANDRLYYELKNRLPEVYLIGDAAGPGRLVNATRQGFDVACKI
jgi:2,4-dienoyl-CoA reductase (NADPH2)